MIYINSWGRFGNSVIRLINILHLALYYNLTIKTPKHNFFDIDIINKNILENIIQTKNNKNIILRDPHNFYYRNKIKNINKKSFYINNKLVINILKKAFTIKDIPLLDKNDIIIHIRSGDIFNNHPHKKYIMPPLSYYNKILNKNNFNKIILVSEDTKNPVINKLINLYPNIIYKKQSLIDDIKIILGGTKIISSFGTFIPYLLLLSDNIINLYQPSYQKTEIDDYLNIQYENYNINRFNIYSTNLENYRLSMFPWKNTYEQRNLMLNYKL